MKILDLEDHMRITSAVSVVAGVVLGVVASAAVQGDAAAQQSAGRRRVIRPEKAPNTGLPFSPGILVGNTLYVSGHLGRDPVTSALVPGGIEPETRQTLENIKAILAQAGSSLDKVVKCSVMIADLAEWPKMNEVYATYFPGSKPARSAWGANGLALGARVEIECTALAH